MPGAAAERDGDFAGSAVIPIRAKPHFLLKTIVLGAAVLAFGGGAVAALVLHALGAIGP